MVVPTLLAVPDNIISGKATFTNFSTLFDTLFTKTCLRVEQNEENTLTYFFTAAQPTSPAHLIDQQNARRNFVYEWICKLIMDPDTKKGHHSKITHYAMLVKWGKGKSYIYPISTPEVINGEFQAKFVYSPMK